MGQEYSWQEYESPLKSDYFFLVARHERLAYAT